MEDYLQATAVIDWQDAAVLELARKLASGHQDHQAIAKVCFEWVRDNVRHSVDHQMNPVTWRASDTLKYQIGYCYAKSHLLAALLRANNIPAGFCYQRLSIDDQGAPYCLHGFNAVFLPEVGWYRIDPRGNREGINAQFTPPKEQLAYRVHLPEEADFQNILAHPLSVIVAVLQACNNWQEVLANPPDVAPEFWQQYALVPTA